jgi:hypothetical protein
MWPRCICAEVFRFQWVVCQLDTLSKCGTVAHVRKTLRELPKTLDDTYIRIIRNIDEVHRSKVGDILTILSFSMRSLNLGEIMESVAFNTET